MRFNHSRTGSSFVQGTFVQGTVLCSQIFIRKIWRILGKVVLLHKEIKTLRIWFGVQIRRNERRTVPCSRELIPAEIINRDQTYNYYFLHFYGLDMVHYLDYQQTIFRIIRRFTDLGTKKFDYFDFDSYMTFLKEFDEECSLIVHLDNLVLKEEFNDFDMFSFPNFGHDIFISERMKQCIEEYRITGLSIKKNFLDYLGEFRIDGTAENAKFK